MFSGLKVVELASVLAGPLVGQFFAELGAEVIKVENTKTGGDVTRTWKVSGEKEGDISAYFCSCNWGKKSLALDLSTREGKAIVQKLICQSDLVIASFKSGDAERLGVDYPRLAKAHPGLIYGQITGYGPDNDRVGYDAVVQAEAGFMDLNGEKNGPPVKMPVALIDIMAAHHLKEGLLLALLKRERTGEGGLVEVSLIQAAIASLANQATNWLVANRLPARQGSSHPNIAPYGDVYETKDGKRILLAVGNDKQFQNLCLALGQEDLATMTAFASNEQRVVHRSRLNQQLAVIIKEWNAKDFLDAMNHAKIPAGSIQNIREAIEMPEAANLLMRSGEWQGIRSFVADWPDREFHQLPAPPGFGEHTKEILQKLQMSK